tara:strand:+ start:423 stop:1127 length:705 start_codon:yes stop_codon:yes gene_type:complete
MLGLGNNITSSKYSWNVKSVGADLKLWLRNGVGVSAASWDDSSGNANGVEQGDVALQGVVHEGGIDFDGSEDHHYDLGTSIICTAQEAFMVFIVCIIDSFDDQNSILGTGQTATFLEFQTNRKLRINTGTSGTASSLQYASGTFATGVDAAVFGIQREKGATGNINLYKNGTKLTPDVQRAQPDAITFNQLGARDSDRTFDGKILELLCYDTIELTDAEILKINNYLKNKFGIA